MIGRQYILPLAHELLGFPDSYCIDRGADGRVLTKSAQAALREAA